MKLQSIIQILKNIAPLNLAEEWDNIGLLINPLKPRNVKTILLTIDLTEAVADEAIAAKADLIIAYHPILFQGIQRLDANKAYDRTVMKLIQKNIAVYSPHTALDAVIGGVNDWLADGVGEGEVSVLHPIENSEAGQGRLVELKRPVKLKTLAGRIKQYLGLKTIRLAAAADNALLGDIILKAVQRDIDHQFVRFFQVLCLPGSRLNKALALIHQRKLHSLSGCKIRPPDGMANLGKTTVFFDSQNPSVFFVLPDAGHVHWKSIGISKGHLGWVWIGDRVLLRLLGCLAAGNR